MTWTQIALGIGSWLTVLSMFACHLYGQYRREQKRGAR